MKEKSDLSIKDPPPIPLWEGFLHRMTDLRENTNLLRLKYKFSL